MPLVSYAPYKEITYRVIGAAMEVHNRLGPGHPEEVYQKALELKLPEVGLSFEAQKPAEVFLDGTALALYYLDLLVEEKVILEIKARSGCMSGNDEWQVIKYFAATDCPVALWVNFGRERLECHRQESGDTQTTEEPCRPMKGIRCPLQAIGGTCLFWAGRLPSGCRLIR